MKRLIVIFFVLAICAQAKATYCADRYFSAQYVKLCICKNHGRGLDAEQLYYKGAVKALNDYIVQKIERGELEDKEFNIYMYDPILTRPHYTLTQSPKSYYIQTGRALTLKELIAVVDEFSQPNFTAVDVGVWGPSENTSKYNKQELEELYEKQEKTLMRLEDRIFEREISDANTISDKEYLLWQQNNMKIIFCNDSVKCFLHDKEVKHSLMGYPHVMKDRYILQNGKTFQVYQDSTLIKIFKYSDEDIYNTYYMDVEIYEQWANFIQYAKPQYSYSYNKNRFYEIEEQDE